MRWNAASSRAEGLGRALDAKSRAAALHRIADAMEAERARGQVAELMTREMGKPYTEAVGELLNVGSIFRYYAEVARDDAGFLAGPTSPGSLQYAKYFPYGISAHILPFNFPIILMAFTAAASLAVGNAIVIKPAPATTSLCTLKFMENFSSLPRRPGLLPDRRRRDGASADRRRAGEGRRLHRQRGGRAEGGGGLRRAAEALRDRSRRQRPA